jgi:hypothetical protein
MNMSEHDKEKSHLDIILEDRPVFFIRWGLVVFVVSVFALLLFIYFAGYDILPYLRR